MKFGYARVSTHDQNLSLQKNALITAKCDKVFEDVISGATWKRDGLDSMIAQLREGDIVVVWRLDRLGRSLKNLIELITQFEEMKVGFVSLQENIDTTTAGGKLVFHIFGAMAEFERNLIRDRTQAGLAAAKARGHFGGRPNKLDDKKRKTLIKLYEENKHTIPELCELFGISKATLFRNIKD